jgi:anti-sigma factor RsiW
MSESTTTCREAIEIVHRVLDGDLMDAAEYQALERHLAVCPECREAADELREVQDALRGLAEMPLPDATLDAVWSRTTRAEPQSVAVARRFDWRLAAAAAIVLLAVFVGWSQWPERNGSGSSEIAGLSEAEKLRAAEDARMVFQLTARALRRTEEVTIREVFSEEISPALRRFGVRWPDSTRSAPDKPGRVEL